MGILHQERPARQFVEDMHSRRVTLDSFIRLLNLWSQLNSTERQEVFDICELEHADMYRGVFPSEDSDEDNYNS